MIRTSLRQIAALHNARVALGSRRVIRPGSEELAKRTGGTAIDLPEALMSAAQAAAIKEDIERGRLQATD